MSVLSDPADEANELDDGIGGLYFCTAVDDDNDDDPLKFAAIPVPKSVKLGAIC